MTDRDIEIIPCTAIERVVDRITKQVSSREVTVGYLLSRGGQFAGVNLSWTSSARYVPAFNSLAAATQAIETVREIDRQAAVAMAQMGKVVREAHVKVPVAVGHRPAKDSKVSVALDADETATLAAIASAMDCRPGEAVKAILRRIRAAVIA